MKKKNCFSKYENHLQSEKFGSLSKFFAYSSNPCAFGKNGYYQLRCILGECVSVAAESITNINTAKKETAVVSSFGGSVSLSCLNRHRMVDGFESKKAAEVRTLKIYYRHKS